MNEVKIRIEQDFKNFAPITPQTHTKSYKTKDEKSKYALHIFASFGIWEYHSLRRAFRSKFFYTSIPIFIDTFFNNEFCYRFTQFRYKSNINFNKETELLIPLKDGIYILKDVNDNNIYSKTKVTQVEFPNPKYLDKIFNTIQNQIGEGKKMATPIIYTGMTN